MKWHGVRTDHIAVRTSRFTRPGEAKERVYERPGSGMTERVSEIDVFGLNYVVKNANATDRLLIVDDVFDGRFFEPTAKGYSARVAVCKWIEY